MKKVKYLLIDDTPHPDRQTGLFKAQPLNVVEDRDKQALVIQYQASLSDPKRRPQLLAYLCHLRAQHPDARILALNEYGRYHIHVRDDMNALRKALSDIPLSAQPASV